MLEKLYVSRDQGTLLLIQTEKHVASEILCNLGPDVRIRNRRPCAQFSTLFHFCVGWWMHKVPDFSHTLRDAVAFVAHLSQELDVCVPRFFPKVGLCLVVNLIEWLW